MCECAPARATRQSRGRRSKRNGSEWDSLFLSEKTQHTSLFRRLAVSFHNRPPWYVCTRLPWLATHNARVRRASRLARPRPTRGADGRPPYAAPTLVAVGLLSPQPTCSLTLRAGHCWAGVGGVTKRACGADFDRARRAREIGGLTCRAVWPNAAALRSPSPSHSLFRGTHARADPDAGRRGAVGGAGGVARRAPLPSRSAMRAAQASRLPDPGPARLRIRGEHLRVRVLATQGEERRWRRDLGPRGAA